MAALKDEKTTASGTSLRVRLIVLGSIGLFGIGLLIASWVHSMH